VKLQPDAKFPLRYRELVGEYFRVMAESGNGGVSEKEFYRTGARTALSARACDQTTRGHGCPRSTTLAISLAPGFSPVNHGAKKQSRFSGFDAR
jgi:hypothetical protein